MNHDLHVKINIISIVCKMMNSKLKYYERVLPTENRLLCNMACFIVLNTMNVYSIRYFALSYQKTHQSKGEYGENDV